jgi:hypothetical protein
MIRENRKTFTARVTRAYLLALIRHTRGNVCTAAKISGDDRGTLYKLLRRHGIDVDAEREKMQAAGIKTTDYRGSYVRRELPSDPHCPDRE